MMSGSFCHCPQLLCCAQHTFVLCWPRFPAPPTDACSFFNAKTLLDSSKPALLLPGHQLCFCHAVSPCSERFCCSEGSDEHRVTSASPEVLWVLCCGPVCVCHQPCSDTAWEEPFVLRFQLAARVAEGMEGAPGLL